MNSVGIYEAKDFLFCNPNKPKYTPVTNNAGRIIGFNMDNIIKVAKQFQQIAAIPDPNRDYALLVFGIYPVKKHLLKQIGNLKNIKLK